MILIYIAPVLFQILYPIIFTIKKLNIIYFLNALFILIVGFYHFKSIENQLIKSNFQCGMPLVFPFFITISFSIILFITYLIQFLVIKRINKKNNVDNTKP